MRIGCCEFLMLLDSMIKPHSRINKYSTRTPRPPSHCLGHMRRLSCQVRFGSASPKVVALPCAIGATSEFGPHAATFEEPTGPAPGTHLDNFGYIALQTLRYH